MAMLVLNKLDTYDCVSAQQVHVRDPWLCLCSTSKRPKTRVVSVDYNFASNDDNLQRCQQSSFNKINAPDITETTVSCLSSLLQLL